MRAQTALLYSTIYMITGGIEEYFSSFSSADLFENSNIVKFSLKPEKTI
jgi:hypothetical protein